MTPLNKKTENSFSDFTSFFFRYSLAAGCLFLILRFLEIIFVSTHHKLPDNLFLNISKITLSEILYFFTLLIPLFLIYLFLGFINKTFAKWIHIASVSIFLFITFLLGQYFAITFIPLGADFWGYSITDIFNTILSSGGLSFTPIFGLLLITTLILYLPRLSDKFTFFNSYQTYLILICLISTPLWLNLRPKPANFNNETEYLFSVNKTHYFLAKSKDYFFEKNNASNNAEISGFPLYKKADYEDVLGDYFNLGKEKPNLVFIIVEGLGADFISDGYLGGFTPFIDSLSQKSLYWENFLSASGRTFGVLPSIFASLPFGENGFMEMAEKMPEHQSLITLLKSNGYISRFFYGGDAGFDKIAEYLERQKTDEIIDEGFFPDTYKKSESTSEGFSWGYADGDVFRFSFEMMNRTLQKPYLDIYLTLSTHEPFLPPNKDFYKSQFAKRVSQLSFDTEKKKEYLNYENEFSSLLYLDESLKLFFKEYAKRDDYSNTIFFITGDHRIIPIPHQSKIDRFHVPLIVFSSMLKTSKKFNSVSSHLDITPTILSILFKKFNLTLPDSVHWLGTKIDTAGKFQSTHSMAFMRSKGEISDYLDGSFFLSENQLFQLSNKFGLEPENNPEISEKISEKLVNFKSINKYVSENNKIFPSRIQLIKTPESIYEDSVFAQFKNQNLDSDQLFQIARTKAFSKDYTKARIICKKLLEVNSNFHDARTLMGRTFAWEKKYDLARENFEMVLKRAPKYSDAYFALAQVEYWDGKDSNSLEYIGKAVSLSPENVEFLMLEAKLLAGKDKKNEALKTVNKILKLKPDYNDAVSFKKKLENK